MFDVLSDGSQMTAVVGWSEGFFRVLLWSLTIEEKWDFTTLGDLCEP